MFDQIIGDNEYSETERATMKYIKDNFNWTNKELYSAIDYRDASGGRLPNYNTTLNAWLEQRSYLPNALTLLDEGGVKAHADFAARVREALKPLRSPSRPKRRTCSGSTRPPHYRRGRTPPPASSSTAPPSPCCTCTGDSIAMPIQLGLGRGRVVVVCETSTRLRAVGVDVVLIKVPGRGLVFGRGLGGG